MKSLRRMKGTGSLFKRRDHYVYEICDINGKKKSVTLKNQDGSYVTTKIQAERIAAALYAEYYEIQQISSKADYLAKVAEVKKIIVRNQVDLHSIWEAYLAHPNRPDSGPTTLKTYEHSLKAFVQYCKDCQLNDINQITPAVAGQYLMQFWKTNIASRTYNRNLQALKLVFRTLLKEDSPFEEFRAKIIETESHKPFTQEQIRKIFAKVDDPEFYLLHKAEMKIMLMLGLLFGLRLHDAACFQWSYIKGNIVEFKPAKTKKHLNQNLVLPIPEILQEQFRNAQAWKVDQYVLPNVAKRYDFNPSGISQDVAKVLTASGIETTEEAKGDVRRKIYIDNNGERKTRHISRYSFHSFRHTFCSMAANAGMDLSVVRSIVGHTNISMTEHYTHYSLESKRQVIASLPLPVTTSSREASLQELIHSLSPCKLPLLGMLLEELLTSAQKKKLFKKLQQEN